MTMKRVKGNWDLPLLHADHPSPVTRRQFLSQGFTSGAGFTIGGIAPLLNPRNANAALSADLDALRAFAMLAGIFLHGLLSFIYIPIWPAQDIYQYPWLEYALDALHGKLAATQGVEIEFAPEPLGATPLKHMMCAIPGGIRVEFIAAE